MTMGARNFNNSLAFIGLCLYAHLASANPRISCRKDDFREILGCTRAMPLDTKCLDEPFGCRCTYNCSHVKELLAADRAAGLGTCLVDGKWYRDGEYFGIPGSEGTINCICTNAFPDNGFCSQFKTSFVKSVLNRVEHIQGRASTK